MLPGGLFLFAVCADEVEKAARRRRSRDRRIHDASVGVLVRPVRPKLSFSGCSDGETPAQLAVRFGPARNSSTSKREGLSQGRPRPTVGMAGARTQGCRTGCAGAAHRGRVGLPNGEGLARNPSALPLRGGYVGAYPFFRLYRTLPTIFRRPPALWSRLGPRNQA